MKLPHQTLLLSEHLEEAVVQARLIRAIPLLSLSRAPHVLQSSSSHSHSRDKSSILLHRLAELPLRTPNLYSSNLTTASNPDTRERSSA